MNFYSLKLTEGGAAHRKNEGARDQARKVCCLSRASLHARVSVWLRPYVRATNQLQHIQTVL